MKQIVVLALTLGIVVSVDAMSLQDTSSRSEHRFGLNVAIPGDPAPTILGVGANLNALEFLRLNANWGTFGQEATSISFGARVLVPGWNLSPFIGMSLGCAWVHGSDIDDFEKGGDIYLYLPMGLDWQSASGFNIGLAGNLVFAYRTFIWPSLYIGGYF